MKIPYIFCVIAVLFVAPALPSFAGTDAPSEEAASMTPVAELKKQKAVGENRLGFLEARRKLSDEETAVVENENAARRSAYEAVAKRAETSVEAVGQARARQIAERSQPGILIQNADGSWREKRVR